MKLKVCILNDDGNEVDHITREIPKYEQYDFVQGLLVDLSLLFRRNQGALSLSIHLLDLIASYYKI